MQTLTPGERRALRAKAHHLHPVVAIGQHGLTPAVLHEIDVNLSAHELIKIRVFSDTRAERAAMLERICSELGATEVQHLGKLLIVWRRAPPEEAAPPRRGAATGKSAARKAPQARRPRSPVPRTPGPPPRGKRPMEMPATPGSRRRKSTERDAAQATRDAQDPQGRRSRGPRSGTGATARPPGRAPLKRSFKSAARPAAVPHGKSSSSSVGAAGARRRRRKAD